jgi:hypothetical protein
MNLKTLNLLCTGKYNEQTDEVLLESLYSLYDIITKNESTDETLIAAAEYSWLLHKLEVRGYKIKELSILLITNPDGNSTYHIPAN